MSQFSTEVDGHEVTIVDGSSPVWGRCESSLLDAGSAVPLEHRSEWVRALSGHDHLYLGVRASDSGGWTCGFPVRLTSPRSVPGHRMARITRVGAAFDLSGLSAALDGLCRWVRDETEVVRLHVELFAPGDDRRQRLESRLQALDLEPVDPPRRYDRTVAVRLEERDEEEVLYSLHSSGRRFIREPGKKGFAVESVEDPAFAGRMASLQEETFARTGGDAPVRDWAEHVRFAEAHPDLYRIVGTFHPDLTAPESLVAFVCGRHNGDHCVYADGASTRQIESSVSLSYAPVWDLITWAMETGCDWFDMGGITAGTADDEDPLGGISDFKRYFSEDLVHVGGEWRFHPPGWRGRLAETAAEVRGALE